MSLATTRRSVPRSYLTTEVRPACASRHLLILVLDDARQDTLCCTHTSSALEYRVLNTRTAQAASPTLAREEQDVTMETGSFCPTDRSLPSRSDVETRPMRRIKAIADFVLHDLFSPSGIDLWRLANGS
jgi:hypothetical protein